MPQRSYAFQTDVGPSRQADLDDIARIGYGILSEPFPLAAAAGTTIIATGGLYLVGIPLLDGDKVSGIASSVSVVGAAQTTLFAGLYDQKGTLLGTSADVKADFATGAVNKISALTSVVSITRSGLYYAAICGVGGTQPTLVRGNATIPALDSISPAALGNPRAAFMTGQTTLPATATFTNVGSIGLWLAAV